MKQKRSTRGNGTFVIALAMVFLAWLGFRSSIIYFRASEIESMVAGLVLQSRQNYNEKELTDKIIEDLKAKFQITIEATQVAVYQKADMSRIHIEITYEEPVRIPVVHWGWDKTMVAVINEKLINNRN